MPYRLPATLFAALLTLLAALALTAPARGQESSAEPIAQIEEVEAGTTYVELDPGFVEALGSLELTPEPLGQAALVDGSLRFPITGGRLTYYEPGTVSPYVQGELRHVDSGLRLTGADGTRVSLTDFTIDPGTSTLTGTVFVDGERQAERAPLFFLDGSTLEPLRTSGNAAILEGTTVELKQEAAALLNQAFGTDALEAGLKIGVAKLVVRATAPEALPIARIDDVPAGTTYVGLDEGFTGALQDLGLTPAPTGDAKLADGSLRFPITGGDLTYYEPGTVSPFVQGLLRHEDSGLSLTAKDGTKVTLSDFRVDPGTSTLTGTVSSGGEQVAERTPLFFLDGSTLEPLRTTGNAAVLQGTTVELKQGAAELLNKTFGTDALEGGLKIGTAKIVARTGAQQ